MTATSVVCPECESPVAPGRLSCQSCGTLLASVVGSTNRYSPPPVDPTLPDVDEDRPLASTRRAAGEPEALTDTVPAAAVAPIEAGPPVPPTQPAKRAPRRLPRPRSSTSAKAPDAAPALDDQTSIFGPVPSVAPPILHSWAGSTGPSNGASAVAPTGPAAQAEPIAPIEAAAPIPPPAVTAPAPRQPRPRRDQPVVATPAATNGATADGMASVAVAAPAASIAGSYLAPSATYASPIVDRPPATRSTTASTPTARTAPVPTSSGAAAAWSSPAPFVAPSGSQNGAYVARGPSAMTTPVTAAAGPTTARRMSDWLVIGGATLAIFSFVLPWATDGVLGSKGIGYTAEWGLANAGHLFLVVVAAAILLLHVFGNGVPGWIRSGVLPIAVGGLLSGLAFAYYARPFGGGTGVAVLLAGAVLLLAGGVVASRPERNEATAPSV